MSLYTPHGLKIRLHQERVLTAYRDVLHKDPEALNRALILTERWEDLPEIVSIATLGGIVFFRSDMLVESWFSLTLVVFLINGIADHITSFCTFLFPVISRLILIPWAKLRLQYLVPIAALSYAYFALGVGIGHTAILLALFLAIFYIFSLPWMVLGLLYRGRLRKALLGLPTHQEDAFIEASDLVAAQVDAKIHWNEYNEQV